MHKHKYLPYFALFVLAAVILLYGGHALAVEKSHQGEDILFDAYYKHLAKLEKNVFGFPLYLESFEHSGTLHVDVYGIFDHPFSSIVSVLKVQGNWCDIASLHPNVKACTYVVFPNESRLTFYIGRKIRQSPEDAHQCVYQYRNVEERQGYLDIVLTAAEGPFGTKDHKMRFEAIPLKEERTFVHVSYTYSAGFPASLAGKIYFATLGRGRSGFTVTGIDGNGNPIYIGGQRGAIERNVVRYYLAIQSFMDTLHASEEDRLTMRLSRWYDYTSRFKRQLFEMEKKDYVEGKTEEYKKQMALQQRVVPALHSAPGPSKP
ncbi:MAG TPA: hypothetical protein VEI46_03585 [Thermodesulfovibrionales bacterium]|nr:hypothetical protein [Thermodesulfovibrionales bacterium]